MSRETGLYIFADYHQFYLEDEGSNFPTENLWDDEQAFLDMLATGPGSVAVGTARHYSVPVKVRVIDSEPEKNIDHWDHVTEASLSVPSGRLVVFGPTEYRPDAPRIAVEPSDYRVRVYYANLESVAANGIDGDDYYEVTLWPGEFAESRVLKRSDWTARQL